MAEPLDATEAHATPIVPTADTSLWLSSDGVGPVLYGCGPRASVEALAGRYEKAKVATCELGPCCQTTGHACSFDCTDDEDIDAAVTLSWALSLAEGRKGDPPYRCARHGVLTFGGCCG